MRLCSTSGGLITTILTELVGSREYEAAFVLPLDIASEEPARLIKVHTPEEIAAASGSKYLPSSVYNVADALLSDQRKYVMVGTPCHIAGVMKFIEARDIDREQVLFLGLFCEGIMNTNFIKFVERMYRRKGENLVKLEYRTKKESGWPGNSRLVFDSGREVFVDRQVRIRYKEYFRINRCLFCPDKLNVGADISFGDCYIPGWKSTLGNSSVIIRTRKGMEAWNRCSHLLAFQEVSIERIAESQSLSARLENARHARQVRHRLDGGVDEKNRSERKTWDGLRSRQKKLRLGANRKYLRIRLSSFFVRAANVVRRLWTIFLFGFIALTSVCKRNTDASITEQGGQNNIIMVGGPPIGTGAQAMTFVAIDQLKRRFPDKNIILLTTSHFFEQLDALDNFRFRVLPWEVDHKLLLLAPTVGRAGRKKDTIREAHALASIIEDAAFFIDISGYSLSSQLGPKRTLNYLLSIIIAKKYAVPYYILPQSLGPFDYRPVHKLFISPLLKSCMRYPRIIFAREMQGVRSLEPFSKDNVINVPDIVLQVENIEAGSIFRKPPVSKEISIEPGSVGLVPNFQVEKRVGQKECEAIYKSLLLRLLEMGKTVYILKHSDGDEDLCERLKMMVPNDKIYF